MKLVISVTLKILVTQVTGHCSDSGDFSQINVIVSVVIGAIGDLVDTGDFSSNGWHQRQVTDYDRITLMIVVTLVTLVTVMLNHRKLKNKQWQHLR